MTGVLYYRQPPKEGCWINWIHEVIHLIQRCHCYVRKIVPCQPRAQLLPHSNGQALVRPSFYQPLVPVSVRRRSAAHVCADAHTDSVAPGDGRIGRVDVGFRSGYRFSQVFQG